MLEIQLAFKCLKFTCWLGTNKLSVNWSKTNLIGINKLITLFIPSTYIDNHKIELADSVAFL